MQLCLLVCLFLARQPPVGRGFLIHDVARPHTTTHRSRLDSSGRVISLSLRPLPDNTQHSQQTNIHASGGIRTHNLSRRASADLRLSLRGLWDQHKCSSCIQKNISCPLQEVQTIDASRKKRRFLVFCFQAKGSPFNFSLAVCA